MTLAVVEAAPLVELARRANAEHAECLRSAETALEHAIRCGEALLQARDDVESRGWIRWLDENFDGSRPQANYYMRMAHYRDVVEDLPHANAARKRLIGMPFLRSPGADKMGDPQIHDEARALKARGLTYDEVGKVLGYSRNTIRGWIDPVYIAGQRERQRQYAARKRGERKREQEVAFARKVRRALRKAGAGIGEAYSLTHKLEDALAQAEREAESTEAKAALAEAVRLHHKMKDEIVRALGVAA